MVRTIEGHQHELLERYDVVMVTDVDELVAPLPEWGTLDRVPRPLRRGVGQLPRLRDRPPARTSRRRYDPARPILDQRGYWFANGAYDKPAIASVECRGDPGFTRARTAQINLDPDLRLVHLHRMDYDICLRPTRPPQGPCLERPRRRRGVGGLQPDHRREPAFDRWFYGESGFEDEGIEMALEPIPASWRGLF